MVESTSIQLVVYTLSILSLLSMVANSDGAKLMKVSSQCTCPGTNLTYECTIMDEHASGATVWTGTAFSCSDTEDELTFLHIGSRFTSTSRGCNDGAIRGRGIRIEGSRYTSQVNITVDSYMDGMSVECVYDQDMGKTLVGNSTIMITPGIHIPLQPPTDIDIVNITVTDVAKDLLQLTFKWTPVVPNCSDIAHIITANNCGVCPSSTFDTEVVCTDAMIGSQCNFTVQISVCNLKTENNNVMSNFIFPLSGPDTPLQVTAIPLYNYEAKNLTKILVTFSELDNYYGLSHYYSISVNHNMCGLANISASSCKERVCEYMYDISTSECHSPKKNDTVSVNVLANNILGVGQPYSQDIEESSACISEPETEYNFFLHTEYYMYNTFISVKIDYNTNITIVCEFHPQSVLLNSTHNCSIAYKSQVVEEASYNSDTVTLIIHPVQGGSQNFIITANNGTHTVLVEGKFNISGSSFTKTNKLTIIVAITTPLLVTITLAILGLICFYVKKKLKTNKLAQAVNRQRSTLQSDSEPTFSPTKSTNQESATIGIYSLLQPSEDTTNENKLIYADIGPALVADGANKPQLLKPLPDDRLEYAQLQHQSQPPIHDLNAAISICDADKSINLDSVLIQLRNSDISKEWYKFGLELGVPKDVMDKYSDYPVDQCMIETVDFWLRHHKDHPTWKEVAKALEAIEFYQLSAKILQVYVTGRPPID